jgi:hypothetical protein
MVTLVGMSEPVAPELLEYYDRLSNWGRWGADDQLGTLNLITDEHRRRAAGLIRHGRTVSCAWDIDPAPQPGDVATAPRRMMTATGEGLADAHRVLPPGQSGPRRSASASEHWLLHPHGYRLTHLDGLSHIFFDGRMYNGRPAELVTNAWGATDLDITGPRHGILTRAVLVDAAAHRGVDWMGPARRLSRTSSTAILAGHRLEVGPGRCPAAAHGVRREGRPAGPPRRRPGRGPGRLARVLPAVVPRARHIAHRRRHRQRRRPVRLRRHQPSDPRRRHRGDGTVACGQLPPRGAGRRLPRARPVGLRAGDRAARLRRRDRFAR